MILSGTHHAQIEHASRGYRWIWGGNQSHQNVAAPPQIQSARVTREQPDHPLPRFVPSKVGPNVNVAPPPQIQSTRVTQQQPDHPSQYIYYLRSKVGPDVNVAPPPQIQSRIIAREQPDHPLPYFVRSKVGPNVNVAPPPQIQQRIINQDLPGHPLPLFWSGNQTHTNVRAPQEDSATVGQETPFHPLPSTRPGVQGPNVALVPQVTSYSFAIREQPGHPPPFAWAGNPPTPEINLPERRTVNVGQLLPDHPLPKTWGGNRPGNTAALPQIVTYSFVIQQLPTHPLPQTSPGRKEIRLPELRAVYVTQYQPDQPVSQVFSGKPILAFAGAFPVLVKQLRLEDLLPPVLSGSLPQSAPLQSRGIIGKQELPLPVVSFTCNSILSTALLQGATINVSSETKELLQSRLNSGTPPTTFSVEFRSFINTTQFYPLGHPLPSFWPGVPPLSLPPLDPTRRFTRPTPDWLYILEARRFIYTTQSVFAPYTLIFPGNAMPTVGVLPPIAPSQVQTIAIDFGTFLPTGVTLTGTPTVTLSTDFGGDPDPQSRISRAPVIGTAGPNIGGTGIPNVAILFQVANCLPGVIYTIEVFCDRTDGDVAEASTRFPCVAPN